MKSRISRVQPLEERYKEEEKKSAHPWPSMARLRKEQLIPPRSMNLVDLLMVQNVLEFTPLWQRGHQRELEQQKKVDKEFEELAAAWEEMKKAADGAESSLEETSLSGGWITAPGRSLNLGALRPSGSGASATSRGWGDVKRASMLAMLSARMQKATSDAGETIKKLVSPETTIVDQGRRAQQAYAPHVHVLLGSARLCASHIPCTSYAPSQHPLARLVPTQSWPTITSRRFGRC